MSFFFGPPVFSVCSSLLRFTIGVHITWPFFLSFFLSLRSACIIKRTDAVFRTAVRWQQFELFQFYFYGFFNRRPELRRTPTLGLYRLEIRRTEITRERNRIPAEYVLASVRTPFTSLITTDTCVGIVLWEVEEYISMFTGCIGFREKGGKFTEPLVDFITEKTLQLFSLRRSRANCGGVSIPVSVSLPRYTRLGKRR